MTHTRNRLHNPGCTSCTQDSDCECNSCSSTCGCKVTLTTNCVKHTGANLECLGVVAGDSLETMFSKVNEILCNLEDTDTNDILYCGDAILCEGEDVITSGMTLTEIITSLSNRICSIPAGAPGADGVDGVDGVDGADGADGADGVMTPITWINLPMNGVFASMAAPNTAQYSIDTIGILRFRGKVVTAAGAGGGTISDMSAIAGMSGNTKVHNLFCLPDNGSITLELVSLSASEVLSGTYAADEPLLLETIPHIYILD